MIEEHVTDWWVVFQILTPWVLLLFVVLFDSWVIEKIKKGDW